MAKNKHPDETDDESKRKAAKDKVGDSSAKGAGKKNKKESPLPGLYIFSEDTIHPRDGQGPLVEPTFNIRKASGKKEMYLGSDWQDFMKNINTPIAFDRIIAPDWGPSKGLNDNGLLKFNALVYPGRNIVRIIQVEKGKDDSWWGLLDSLDVSSLPVLEPGEDPTVSPHPEYDAPHHYHTVYSCTKNGAWFLQENAPVVPIINFQEEHEQWIQMEKLTPIELPKTVTVTNPSGVAVCVSPGDLTVANCDLAENQTAIVDELRIARGGIWGHIETGWIALRYNDLNQTDWII